MANVNFKKIAFSNKPIELKRMLKNIITSKEELKIE